jgi:hypothetical protein
MLENNNQTASCLIRPRPTYREFPDFGTLPPWCPIPTPAAARFLGVHPKTLLRWRRHGVGPEPEPKGKYTKNCVYWLPSKLRAWHEHHFAPPGRSSDEIVWAWMKETPRWCYDNWPFPARANASAAVLRRRQQWAEAREA